MNSLFDAPTDASTRPVMNELQRDLYTRGRAAYTTGIRRVLWQASCGAGKTVIASEQTVAALGMNRTVLHVVHRRRLVDQMIGALARFDVKASPIMDGRHTWWDAKVHCASRDTLLAMLKAGHDLPRKDLIIWDEAHVASNELQRWYLDNCPNAYWTGYTATPVCSDGRSMNPPYQALVCMAPASALIRIGRLCPVTVYNPDAIGRRRRKGEKVKPVGDPVDHWKKYAFNLPTVVFAATVNDSQAICQRYLEAGVTAEHIDASTPEEEREAVFERSRLGVTKVICNVGVLVEGVDLPWLTCCQILRGCNSLVLWIQATGRVMRFFERKSHGVVLDHSGAAHEYGLPDSDFVWTLEDGAANERKNKPPKDRQPVTCVACGMVFVGKAACPSCGRVLSRQQRKSALGESRGDGLLTEFSDAQDGHIAREALEREWNKLLYIGRAKGWEMRTVAAAFSKKAKRPPWEADLSAKLPFGSAEWSTPVREWMEAVG